MQHRGSTGFGFPSDYTVPTTVFVMLPVELGAVTTSDFVRFPLLAGMPPANVHVTVFPVMEQPSAARQPET